MTTINLEDELALSENKWRGRIITFGIVALIAFGILAALWYFVIRDDTASVTRSTEEIPVTRSTISQTLTITGTADAQLNSNLTFQSSGKVTEVNVKVGDAVTQGQVLASLESDDLSNGVDTARASLVLAQLKLTDLLDGATPAEIAAADQALAQAQAAVVKAKNDYQDLLDGGSAADVATAEQGVGAAQAQVATAQSARDKLNPTAADKATAQSGVSSAQSALTASQNSAANADNSVSSAESALKVSESGYCVADNTPAFCITRTAPVSDADLTIVTNAPGAAATAAASVLSANTAYRNAVNSASSAHAAVTSSQEALTAAQKKLDAVNAGPTSAETAAADATLRSAQIALIAATSKLNDAKAGGTAIDRADAKAAVDSSEATLASAQAQRDEVVRGPTQNAVAQARQGVISAQLALEAAQIRLKDAQIVAPFDGVVAAVNAKVGEFGSAAGGAASSTGTTTAPIVLLTPNLVLLKMSVQETDYANIKLDQGGVVLFDALPGKPFPFKVTSIGAAPTTTNGVVTYQVTATLAVPPGGPAPAPGMNGRGLITTDSKANVVAVPPRAIRRRGADQIVTVKRANGDVEEQVVTTGVSDTNNVEILTGLAEGDTVEVATLTTAKGTPTPKAQPTIPGGLR